MSSLVGEYLDVIQAHLVQQRGALRFLEDEGLRRMRELGHKFTPEVEQVDARTWRAPSTWHAAAWLGNAAENAALSGIGTEGGPPELQGGNLLFRGQRDPRWKLEPSLHRSEDPVEHYLALIRFQLAMSELIVWEEVPDLPLDVHAATAQHYGVIQTPLLDFTMDPAMAVYFACDGAEENDEAVVYFLGTHDAVNAGARFMIAPPWIRRIYTQSGVFVAIGTEEDAEALKERCSRMLFPVNHSFGASSHGYTSVEAYPEDPWLTKASRWALEAVHSYPHREALLRDGELRTTSEHAKRLESELVSAVGTPPFEIDGLTHEVQGWLDFFTKSLECLALKHYDGGFKLDAEIVRSMYVQNRAYFDHLLFAMKVIEEHAEEFERALGSSLDQNAALRQLMSAVRAILKPEVERGEPSS